MKYLSIALLAALLIPSSAFAFDLSHLGDEIQRQVQALTAGAASSQTGGSVQVENSVSSSGGSSASSQVSTYIESNNGGGSVTTHTETSEDGQTKVEDYHQDFGPGQNIDIASSTKVGNTQSDINVHVQGGAAARGAASSSWHSVSSSWQGASSSSSSAAWLPPPAASPLSFLRSIFGHFLTFLRFW